jgi:hypothetical protein
MRTFRVFFKKDGINMTKLVYAESMFEVIQMFKDMEIAFIKEIDLLPEGDIDIISLN